MRRMMAAVLALATFTILGSPGSVASQTTLTLAVSLPVGSGPMTPLLDEGAGRVFVPNELEATFTIVDTATRAVVATVALSSVEGVEIRAAAIDPERHRLFVLTDSNDVSTIDTRSGDVLRRTAVPDEAQDMAVDAARGRVYVLSSMPSRLTTLSATSGSLVGSAKAPVADLLAPNPRTGRLFMDNRSATGGIVVVDPRTGSVIWSLRSVDPAGGFVFNASGRRAYVPLDDGEPTGTVVVVDTKARRVLGRLPVGRSPLGPALDPGHQQGYVGSVDGRVTVFDTGSNAITGSIAVTGRTEAPVVDTGNGRLYVAASSATGGEVTVFDTATNTRLAGLPLPGGLSAPTIDSTGTWLYITSSAMRTLSIVAVSP